MAIGAAIIPDARTGQPCVRGLRLTFFKMMKIVFGVRFLGALALLAATGSAQTPLTPEQWRQDLQFLAAELPRKHKNLFYELPKAEFERQVRALDAAIPSMTELQIRAALTKLVASARNAHTTINGLEGTPAFPIEFLRLGEDMYVTAIAAGHERALQARLVAVNDTPARDVWSSLLPYVPQENDVIPTVMVPGLLRSAAMLFVEQITPGIDRARFELEREGERFTIELASSVRLDAIRWARIRTEPRALKEARGRGLDYWFEYLPEEKTIYVQYNACRDMAGQPFKEFTAQVMKAVDSQPVERFVIDLRYNGGGDSKVIKPMLEALKLRKRLKLYALVGRYTFSSGYMAARDLKNQARAVLVGEAMGQKPNGYGDIRPLKLPNSGLTAWYCTKFFRLEKGDPRQVEPDVPAPTEARDYFSGRDAAMEYAVTH